MTGHALVVGGGLAGISAAVALREAGVAVTLLEARPRLGGATHSFTRDGLLVDNGQHVFLGCCTAYRGLLDRLGVADRVTRQNRFDVPVLTPGGPGTRLRRTNLPGPVHFGPALARYPLLSPAERLGAVRAALAMRRLDASDPATDRRALGAWLTAHGQGEHAQRALWDLFVISALNIRAADASLGLAAKVCQTGLLGRRDAADIGMSAVPLGELHGTAAAKLLAGLGADVRCRTKVSGIDPPPASGRGDPHPASGRGRSPQAGDRLTVHTEHGVLRADAVIVAVPHAVAARILPAEAASVRWRELGAMPILNVHVIYDRPVTRHPYVAAVGSPVQWVFDRTRAAGLSGPGQYLAVSVSAADDRIDRRVAELRAEFLPALERLFPAARDAGVRDFFVTREPRATFRQTPGTGALRPPTTTRTPGLYIAGAWTDTGWPDTMEGAVRSGLQAARIAGRRLPSMSHRTARDQAEVER